MLDTFKNSYSKAVVLINTSDDYEVAFKLISGVTELLLPVVVVSKSDGDQILKFLEEDEAEDVDVYARIDAENMVDEVDTVAKGIKSTTSLHIPLATEAGSTKKTSNAENSISETIPMHACDSHMIVIDS